MFVPDLRRTLSDEDVDCGPTSALARIAFYQGVQAVGLYRLASWLAAHGLRPLGRIVSLLAFYLLGCEISPRVQAGPGLVVAHPAGVVIHGDARLGRNVTVGAGVVIGVRDGAQRAGVPNIGDGVLIGAGAKLLGPITIADGAQIGAGAVVIGDVPAGGRAVGVPARVL